MRNLFFFTLIHFLVPIHVTSFVYFNAQATLFGTFLQQGAFVSSTYFDCCTRPVELERMEDTAKGLMAAVEVASAWPNPRSPATELKASGQQRGVPDMGTRSSTLKVLFSDWSSFRSGQSLHMHMVSAQSRGTLAGEERCKCCGPSL